MEWPTKNILSFQRISESVLLLKGAGEPAQARADQGVSPAELLEARFEAAEKRTQLAEAAKEAAEERWAAAVAAKEATKVAEQAKEAAEDQLAAALARRNAAEEQAAKYDGTYFLSFQDLRSVSRKVLDPSDPNNSDYLQSIRNADTMLKFYLPDNVTGKTALPEQSISIGWCRFDFLNNPQTPPIVSYAAHVIPFGKPCLHRFWEKFIRFRLNMNYQGNLSLVEKMRYDMWLFGYNTSTKFKPASTKVKKISLGIKKSRRSQRPFRRTGPPELRGKWIPCDKVYGYLNSAPNLIAAQHPFQLFDTLPSFMCLPVCRNALQLWNCCDGALDFIIIASTPEVYRWIAAVTSIATMSQISCKDPDVIRAFEVFGEVMSVAIGVVCDDDHERAPKTNLIQEFRTFLKENKTFQSPCVNESGEGYFLKVSYNPPRSCRPGGKLKQWKDFDAHQTPDPINLMCRSFNAFSTYLYQRKMLDGFKIVKYPSCKLFPSCLDIKGRIDCELCIASWLLYGSGWVSCLSSNEREKLLDVLTLTRSGKDLKQKYSKVRTSG